MGPKTGMKILTSPLELTMAKLQFWAEGVLVYDFGRKNSDACFDGRSLPGTVD